MVIVTVGNVVVGRDIFTRGLDCEASSQSRPSDGFIPEATSGPLISRDRVGRIVEEHS